MIPQAFGKFGERNLIAWDVCDSCNSFFGRSLDQLLARETYEGHLRFEAGVKPVKSYKPPRDGRRVRTFGKDGPWAGMELRPRVDSAGGQLVQAPIAQIGFARTAEDPPTFYPAEQLPTPEALKAVLGPGEFFMRAVGFDSEQAITAVLKEAGYGGIRHVGRDPTVVTDGTRIRVKRNIIADRPVLRAIAKIGFNYLITTQAALSRMPQFRAIKDYILHDRDPGSP